MWDGIAFRFAVPLFPKIGNLAIKISDYQKLGVAEVGEEQDGLANRPLR
jgi:hypothetical protein